MFYSSDTNVSNDNFFCTHSLTAGLNIRFRAKKHAMSFIDILEEPEVNGDEQLAAETYRSRGLQF